MDRQSNPSAVRRLLSLITLSLFVAFALSLGACSNQEDTSPIPGTYKPGEIIVKYKDSVGPAGKALSREQNSLKPMKSFYGLNMELVKLDGKRSMQETLAALNADPSVEYAEPNFEVSAYSTPNDPMFPTQWGNTKIRAPQAWDATLGSSDVVVGVIDTGVDFNHPDLVDNMWTNDAEANGTPGVDDDNNGVIDDVHGLNAVANNGSPMDDHNHGTHVAGIIGASGDNGVGIAGVNWHVKIMALKFMGSSGSGSISDAIECLSYARMMKDRGVNIVATNNSWGSTSYSQALYDAIWRQKDILFVAAAGNAAANNDQTPHYPASYNIVRIISVAATNSDDTMASFSCYGNKTVDVAAPGSSILSTLPGNKYGNMSGTSMATPFVTGLCALIAATDPTYDWKAIKNLILAGGNRLPSLSGKTLTGRQADAMGALSCTTAPFKNVLAAPNIVRVGTPAILAFTSIVCDNPVGPVTVTLAGGEVLNLLDNGIAPDQAKDDGVFTIVYTPTRNADSYVFTSPLGVMNFGKINPLAITTSSVTPASTNAPYTFALAASGGASPYTWSVKSGSLPSGITLNAQTGVISGQTANWGNFPVVLGVRDMLSNTATFSATLYSVPASVTISTAKLPDATQKTSYGATLSAIGGTAPYTWTLVSSSMSGFTVNSTTGLLYGTPSAYGNAVLSIRVRDAKGVTNTKTLTVKVFPSALAITSASLPIATKNYSYSVTLAGTGGYVPYAWSAKTALPAGLTLNPTTGQFSGKPTVAGTYNLTFGLTDNSQKLVTKSFTLTVR